MSNLIDHARNELQAAGLFDKDSDYEGATGDAVMALIEVFSRQDHSGSSAALVTELFSELSQYKAITPITDRAEDWYDHGDFSQNRRQSNLFSLDGGRTYYNIDDKPTLFYRLSTHLPSWKMRQRVWKAFPTLTHKFYTSKIVTKEHA